MRRRSRRYVVNLESQLPARRRLLRNAFRPTLRLISSIAIVVKSFVVGFAVAGVVGRSCFGAWVQLYQVAW